jgi:hypothetical protein
MTTSAHWHAGVLALGCYACDLPHVPRRRAPASSPTAQRHAHHPTPMSLRSAPPSPRQALRYSVEVFPAVSLAVGSHSTRAALAIPWPATHTGFAEPCRWCAHSTRDRVLRWEHFGRLRLRLEGRERGFVDRPHDSEVIGSGLIATPAATARCAHRTPGLHVGRLAALQSGGLEPTLAIRL